MNKQVCAEPMREAPAATKAEGFTTSRHLRPRLMSGEGANAWQRPRGSRQVNRAEQQILGESWN